MKRCPLVTQKKQIKIIMRYYFIPSRLAKMKKTRNTKCWWGCRTMGMFILCWWKCRLMKHFRKQSGIILFIWIRYMVYNPAFPLLSIFPKESCACVPQVLRAALVFNSKILWVMFMDRKVSKTSKTQYISRMPIYEVKNIF